jgi:hypothetical protein
LDIFKPVTDKGTDDKDYHEDHYLNKNTEHSQKTDPDTYFSGNKEHRHEHENNPQNKTGDRPIPKDAREVFLSTVKKAKCYTDDEIQQFKPHVSTPDLKQNIIHPALNKLWK